ncbi:RagB/SusD family nutrient uptake outer membrane protein [Sphingobacterium yanglingense]|uniref:SusD-like starch-binding protein associating with outer membrane n=1 Tax=Sphingobacterium yanglingense TaxID=1437280 RepID=A0A4R6WEK7_9SPHI|nr:RagB/SusD family nutrient uptake outer membrane protein [Sphingobacterium yanglingense]TDQ73660.1 SusD-like starch-binding protein associating with outer membrane [Sphingobacterium yanglingense]
MKAILKMVLVGIILNTLGACTHYLEMKPDQKMVVPQSLEDCDAILDDYFTMNAAYPVFGEAASDLYYLTEVDYKALTVNHDRGAYVWDPKLDLPVNSWQGGYKVVAMANLVLEVLKKIDRGEDVNRYDRILGSALFFRAYAYAQLADVFALPYESTTAESTMGLVLRNTANVDEISTRSSLKTTYARILADLEQAAELLPSSLVVKTRPSKAAAYAAIARVALIVQDFPEAEKAAESSLGLYSELIDFNGLNMNAAAPFANFNKEMLFYGVTLTSSVLNPAISKIDSFLFDSYANDDLRQKAFFKSNGNQSYAFKGKYDGQINYSSFAGIAVDEVYLILAESLAHRNKVSEAMEVLNRLLKTRWVTSKFMPMSANDKPQALDIIWTERKKSLIMRNLRWSDIKRQNLLREPKITLTRKLGNEAIYLPPNDLRFAFPIPMAVVKQTPSIIQNPR